MASTAETQTPAVAQNADSAFMKGAGGAGSCSAQRASTGDASEGAETATQMNIVEGEEARTMTLKAAKAIKEGEVSMQASPGALAREEVKVRSVESAEVSLTSVTFPINGEYSTVSNFTVLFDASGDIVQYGETLITENEMSNFNITTYSDGELVESNDTDLAYMSDAELESEARSAPSKDMASTMGTGSTVACVAAVLGVSAGGIATVVVLACGGACTVPVAGTAICVACIGAYAAISSGSVAAVATCF